MKSIKNNELDNQFFDDQFKTKFEGFEPSVMPELWKTIESELDEKSEHLVFFSRFITTRFFKYGAVAATILVAFAVWKWNDAEVIYLKKTTEALVSVSPVENPIPRSEAAVGNNPLLDASGKITNPTLGNQNRESKTALETTGQKEEATKASKVTREDIVGDSRYALIESITPSSSSTLSINQDPIDMEEYIKPGQLTLTLKESSNTNEAATNRGSEVAGIELVSSENEDEEIDNSRKKKLGISTVLNFLAKGISGTGERSLQFSESEEGILKLDLKLGLAKTKN